MWGGKPPKTDEDHHSQVYALFVGLVEAERFCRMHLDRWAKISTYWVPSDVY